MKAQSIHASPACGHRLLWSVAWVLTITIILRFGVPQAQALTFTAEEQKLANLLVNASGQRRDKSQMRPDDRLIQVARARAMDMAKRRYFDHTNPDGVGANYLVRQTGYQLPSHYSSGNNIESIGAGYLNASEAWGGWMGSSGHKTHLLGTTTFYRDQTSYGVGHYYDSSSPYKHYWVVITAPPSPVATLSIATPTSGARVSAPAVAVTGNVSGNAVFSSLQYRLENQYGAGNWTPIPLHTGSGVAKFTANVAGLQPGMNTVRVRTTNSSGGVARETTRSVRLVIVKPLAVSIDGNGTVTPGYLGTTQREMGAALTIAALPRAGYILSHWSGLPAGMDPYRGVQTFPMQEGLSLTAHFIADPYPALAAGYAGVFTDTGPAHPTSGAFFVKTTSGGAFTGALFFAGKRYALRSRFNSQGDAVVTVPRAGQTALVVNVHIDTTGADQRITGTVTDGTATLALNAGRSPGATTPGVFNVHVAPGAGPAQGHGFAMVSVNAAGNVRITGLLADGSPLAAASYVTNGAIPVYVPLLGGIGSLAGTLTLNGTDVQGTLAWHKPARPGTRFPEAWSTQHTVTGSAYVPPAAGAASLPLGSAALLVDSPELPEILSLPIHVTGGTRITYPTLPVPAGWRVAINPRNGRFTGTYKHPGGTVRAFTGLVDSAAGNAYGYSLGTSNSAAVVIE